MPEEVWTEFRDIVQEVMIKTIPKKKAKWLSDEVLEIAVKRREAKGKGEKERYMHLNAEEAEEAEIKLPTFVGSTKKQESSRKPSISALLTTPKKALTVWITINCGKFLK